MNYLLSLIFTCALWLVGISAFAQSEAINTDRPDQSDGTYTVPRNVFQIENGLFFANGVALNNFMLRYGAAKTTELRLLVDAGEVGGNWGVFPLTLSVKQRLLAARKWIPAISLVGYVNYGRIATNDFQDDGINYQATLAFENNLSDKVTLGYNIGTNNNFRALILTTGFSYTINDKLSAYIEYFSNIGHASSAHNADGGLLYLINPHFQLDIACGHSIFSKDPRVYVTTGVSYMFERKENK